MRATRRGFSLASGLIALTLSTAGATGAEIDSMEVKSPEKTLVGHDRPVVALAAFDSGRKLASGDESGVVILWNVADAKAIHRWSSDSRAKVAKLVVSADGKRVAAADAAGVLRVWNAESGERVYESPAQSRPARLLAASRGGEKFVTVGVDESIVVFSPPDAPKSVALDDREKAKSPIRGVALGDPRAGVVVLRDDVPAEERSLPDWRVRVLGWFPSLSGPILGVWTDAARDRCCYATADRIGWGSLDFNNDDDRGRVPHDARGLVDLLSSADFAGGKVVVGLTSGHLTAWVALDDRQSHSPSNGFAVAKRKNPAKDATALAILDGARFAAGRPDGAIDVWFVQAVRPNSRYWYVSQRPQLNKLLADEDHEGLETLIEKLRASGERFPEGWRITGGVYDVLAEWPLGAKLRVGQLERWIEKRPKAIPPRVALGQLYVKWGWAARGTGVAAVVSDENMKLFHERLAKARDVLEDALELGPKDAHVHRLLIEAGIGLSAPPEEVRRLFREGRKLDPQDLQLFETATQYFLPRWHGAPGDGADLLDEAVEDLPPDDADELYARTVAFAMRFERSNLPQIGGYDEKRIRRGAEVLLERHPDETKLHQSSLLYAYHVDDLATAKKLLPAVGVAAEPTVFGDSPRLWPDVLSWARQPEGDPGEVVKLHPSTAYLACFTDGGRLAVAAHRDSTIAPCVLRCWSPELGLSPTIELPIYLTELVGSPKGKLIAFEAQNDQNREKFHAGIIDIERARLVGLVDLPKRGANVVFSPDAKQLLMTCHEEPWRLYDAQDLSAEPRLITLKKPTWIGEFTPDGKHVVAAPVDGVYVVYDAESGEAVREFKTDPSGGAPVRLVFSGDGRKLLAAGTTHSVKVGIEYLTHWGAELWDFGRGERLASSRGEEVWSGPVAISDDGALVASGDARRDAATGETRFVVTLRDGNTLEEKRTFLGHYRNIVALRFTPDGKKLHSVGADGRLRVWDLPKLPTDRPADQPRDATKSGASSPAESGGRATPSGR